MIEVDFTSPAVSPRNHVVAMEWLTGVGDAGSEHRRLLKNKINKKKKNITILPSKYHLPTKVRFNLEANKYFPKENDDDDSNNNNYLTESEMSAMWLKGKDIALNARRERELAHDYCSRSSSKLDVDDDDDDNNDEEQFTLRGLEDFATARAALRTRNRRGSARKAVLDEQRKQKASEKYEPNKIRDRSMDVSRQSRDIARQLALQDEDEVLKIQGQTDESKSLEYDGTNNNKGEDKSDKVASTKKKKKKCCRLPPWSNKKNTSIDKEEHDVVKKKKFPKRVPSWPMTLTIERCANVMKEEEKEVGDIILPARPFMESRILRHEEGYSAFQLSYQPRHYEVDRESRMLLVDNCFNTTPQQQQQPPQL